MRIVQLSDLHLRPTPLYSGLDPWAAWQQAMLRVTALAPRPDLLLLTGDLADDGEAATYQRLAEALAGAGLPHAVLPGNHDARPALRAAFPAQAWSDPALLCQRLDIGEWTLLLLDTVLAGEEGGELTQAHIDWLDAHCPAGRPSIVVMHHPPFKVGIAGMDAINCRGGEHLAAWLFAQPQVAGLWCGHVHRPIATVFAGRPALTAPATIHQIALQDGPLAWTAEPGGLLVHDFDPGQPPRTHYLPLAAAAVHRYED